MTVVTIPKNLIQKDDLVIIPRKEYENFLHLQKRHDELDRDLDRAIRSYKKGKYFGPFTTVEEGMDFLKTRRRKRR